MAALSLLSAKQPCASSHLDVDGVVMVTEEALEGGSWGQRAPREPSRANIQSVSFVRLACGFFADLRFPIVDVDVDDRGSDGETGAKVSGRPRTKWRKVEHGVTWCGDLRTTPQAYALSFVTTQQHSTLSTPPFHLPLHCHHGGDRYRPQARGELTALASSHENKLTPGPHACCAAEREAGAVPVAPAER
jgi:hypothetical protein